MLLRKPSILCTVFCLCNLRPIRAKCILTQQLHHLPNTQPAPNCYGICSSDNISTRNVTDSLLFSLWAVYEPSLSATNTNATFWVTEPSDELLHRALRLSLWKELLSQGSSSSSLNHLSCLSKYIWSICEALWKYISKALQYICLCNTESLQIHIFKYHLWYHGTCSQWSTELYVVTGPFFQVMYSGLCILRPMLKDRIGNIYTMQ